MEKVRRDLLRTIFHFRTNKIGAQFDQLSHVAICKCNLFDIRLDDVMPNRSFVYLFWLDYI